MTRSQGLNFGVDLIPLQIGAQVCVPPPSQADSVFFIVFFSSTVQLEVSIKNVSGLVEELHPCRMAPL